MTAATILRATGPLVEVRTRDGVAATSPPGAIPAVEVAAVLAALGCAAAVADPVRPTTCPPGRKPSTCSIRTHG
jgi:hypothetical protein